MFTEQQIACLRAIQQLADEGNLSLYLVGGGVRDFLAKRPMGERDLDIVVEGDAAQFGSVVAKRFGGELREFRSFLTAKLNTPAQFPAIEEIDFASCRREAYSQPGALPTVAHAPLLEDLRRRDFSINAIALPLTALRGGVTLSEAADFESLLIDPFQGRSDLAQGLIRILHPASFSDDPTRLYRAIRYHVRLGGVLETDTKKAFNEAIVVRSVESVSMQRRFNEVIKMMLENDAHLVLNRASEVGLLEQTFDGFGVAWNRWAQIAIAVSTHPELASKVTSRTVKDVLIFAILMSASKPSWQDICQGLGIGKKRRKELLFELEKIQTGKPCEELSPPARIVFAALYPEYLSLMVGK